MSKPIPVQTAFARMIRDKARSDLPKDACWDLVDIIPNLDAPARRRGPWTNYSTAWSSGSGANAAGIVYAPFTTNAGLVISTSTGKVVAYSTGSPVDKGAGNPSFNPFFYRDLVIMPSSTGAGSTVKFDGSAAPASIVGAPGARCGFVHKDHAVLGGGVSLPRRWYFSSAGDPTTWDTTNGWFDVESPIIGGMSLRGAMLSLETDKAELIRGDIPPPGPSSDFTKNVLGDQGCMDGRSIASYRDQAIWANRNGIWVSDGTAPWDLTKMSGVNQYWQSLMQSYTSSVPISAGVYRGQYIISLGTGIATTLIFDIDNRAMVGRFTNLSQMACFASTEAAGREELYGGPADNTRRVAQLSSIWTPSGDADGSGAAIQPAIETPFYNLEGPSKRLERVFLSYELPTTGAIKVSWYASPEASASAYAISDAFGPTTALERKRLLARMKAYGFAFRIAGSSPGSPIGDLRVYGIEVDARAMDGAR